MLKKYEQKTSKQKKERCIGCSTMEVKNPITVELRFREIEVNRKQLGEFHVVNKNLKGSHASGKVIDDSGKICQLLGCLKHGRDFGDKDKYSITIVKSNNVQMQLKKLGYELYRLMDLPVNYICCNEEKNCYQIIKNDTEIENFGSFEDVLKIYKKQADLDIIYRSENDEFFCARNN